uniref:Alsin Rho guanine nucleotide exchange factor ALS2 n=1 Tax=Salarias fasciatus TaxID=181472 RepID=A0A672IXI3_SALFA
MASEILRKEPSVSCLCYCSLADEQASSAPERGLLHIWRPSGYSEQLCPERVLLSRPVLQVSLGEHHGLLLTQGGQVYSFGELLWRNESIPVSAPVLEVSLLEKTVVHVAAGGFHCGALTEQGGVYMWGENTAGQCGMTEDCSVPVPEPCAVSVVDSEANPPVVVRIMELACGREHSLALSTQHELWAWGSGCQLGLVTSTFPVWRPQKVEHLAGRHVIQVACGAYHSLAVVRSLTAQENITHNPLKRRERSQSPHPLLLGSEELSATDDAHYCPLGVELTEAIKLEVNTVLVLKYKNSFETNTIVEKYFCDYSCITDSRSHVGRSLQSGWRPNKSSAFSDEQQLQNILKKLSAHSLETQQPQTGSGDSDSLSSHTSGQEEMQSLCLFYSFLIMKVCCVFFFFLSNILFLLCFLCIFLSGSPRTRPCACRPSSAGRGQTATPEEAVDRLPSLETEVWSWGRGSEGQLGHGDHLARLQPLCIKSLTGEEVIRVAAGSHHSLALTAQCQVYTWGSNMCGQLGHVNSPVTVPQQVKLSDDLRIWDVSAGQSHSLLLADGDCVQPVLLYCGQQQDPERSGTSMGYISSVSSGGRRCAVLEDHNVRGFISAIHELASRERQLFCWSSRVRTTLLTPLRNRESISPALGEQCTHLFFSLCESFLHLSTLIGRHAASLSDFLRDIQRCDVTLLPLLTHTDRFQDSYRKYCSAVGDFQVMGGFQPLQKLALDCLGHKHTLLAELCGSSPSGKADVDLVSILYWPLQQLHHYNQILLKLAACYDVLTVEYQFLHQGCSNYESLSLSLLRRKREAEITLQFWKSHSGKTAEVLRLPRRRVVCESSNRSLTLQNAGRFSNHWFILFNDALVHTQFTTHHVYPLASLWVKPPVFIDCKLLSVSPLCIFSHAIKITCPEESFTVVASTPQEKNKWLRSLTQAVDQALGGGGQGSARGETAMSRTVSHTFIADERLKGAQYSGGWLAGRIHGRGTMKWPDGRTYHGNFKNGLEDGYGSFVEPNKVLNKPDSYQGQWREGKIHGFGKYKYASGEVYEGCFYEGQRHGYGMLSSGKLLRSSSSFFIGQWVHGRKTGYGVHEDITRGEKYMGMWQDDQRHGSAVVVTQHGVYYEGTFKENKMSGSGRLVSEDDTVFHGEFSDDWTVSGKGVLCLPNGDCLKGQFTGEWNTGLNVVGLYTKPGIDEPDKKELGQYAVPSPQRWMCVFEECWSRLGCDAPGRGERSTAWENIAVSITSARRQSPDLSRSQSKLLESLEFIPQCGQPVNTANYDNIRRYLTKACETLHHPLGWLVETLVTAYRMTYVGVGSNRRLLRQAVEEVQSYLTHLYSIIRFLFPELPEDGDIIPEPSNSSLENRNIFSNEGVLVLSRSALLLPLLLPRLYPPLFTLYCLQEEQEESRYWERILRLNKQPDHSLLGSLGVPEKFWPLSISVLGEKKEIASSSKDLCFLSALETLQQISTTFTPSDKLMVIKKTFEELTQEVRRVLDDKVMWCMDDLFPLFLYVVLRARIRNLGAEVCLIEDLMDPNIQHGELGLMLTTLKACYFQIQLESTT